MAKTWREKFHNGQVPYVAPSVRPISGFPTGSQMLIPNPSQVDRYIKSIPVGESRTKQQMSRDLAQSSGAELTCPMCCGLFLRICAEKAYEEYQAGTPIESVTPFWRVMPPGSSIRNKLTFDISFVDLLRAKELSLQ